MKPAVVVVVAAAAVVVEHVVWLWVWTVWTSSPCLPSWWPSARKDVMTSVDIVVEAGRSEIPRSDYVWAEKRQVLFVLPTCVSIYNTLVFGFQKTVPMFLLMYCEIGCAKALRLLSSIREEINHLDIYL